MRGQPDYGMYAPKEVGAGISDLGELGVRLGSIDSYDKRGDVVAFDDFEATVLRWLAVGSGVMKLDSSSVKSGSQALYIETEAVAGSHQYLSKGFQILGVKRIGNELSFSNLSSTSKLYTGISWYDGEDAHLGEVFINPSTEKLSITDSDGNEKEIADTGVLFGLNFAFYTVKLVVDFTTDKYVRLLFGDKEEDISDEALFVSPVVLAPQYKSFIHLRNLNAVKSKVWVEDFILTQAEP